MPDPAPQRDAILAALERLLVWSEIARSPQLSRFLDYIVRRTLDGDEQAIKAYSIAVDVFGRATDFDPQVDPIVRVQARRLRGLLEQYYVGAGRGEAVQVRLPVGRYVPEFHTTTPALTESTPLVTLAPAEAPAVPPLAGVHLSWFALLVLTAGIMLTAYALSTWGPRQQGLAAAAGAVQPPSITIVEFQNLAGQGASAPMVAGLAIELVTDLEQFDYLDVNYGGGVTSSAEGPISDYVLTGIVRPDGPIVQYSAILTDRLSGDVVWNFTIPVTSLESRSADVLDTVSRSLSLVLGSSRGPLHVGARAFLASAPPLHGQVNLYLCRVLFDIYRESAEAPDADRVHACIGALPQSEREGPLALAMMASLVADYLSPTVSTTSVAVDRFLFASNALARAIVAAPISGFVWEQQARLHQAMGQFDLARADFGSSLQLNPASVDALAAYARLLAFGGDLSDADRPARDALDGPLSPPAWYHGVPALLALRDGRYADAIASAELYAQADRELGPILAIMAGQGANDSAIVNRYLPQVLDVASFRSRGVLTRLRDRITDDALMNQIRASLVSAGVPAGALVGSF